MGRIILLTLAVVVLVWLVRRALGASPRSRAGSSARQGELVRCAKCGLYLPKGEAKSVAGRYFCCEEHARGGAGDA